MPQMHNRNQKLAAKAARRKAAVADKKQAERLTSSLAGRVAVAAGSPVERSLRTTELFDAGIGHVIMAKRLPSGALGCAFFLVDVFCLGVKDVFYTEMSPSDLDQHLEKMTATEQRTIAVDPPANRKLVMEAVAYAVESGLGPAKDYRTVMKIFGDIDPALSGETFTFGKDGKPFYIQGPNDKPARIREIVQALRDSRGEDGWNYLLAPQLTGRFSDDDDASSSFDDDDRLVIDHEGSTDPETARIDDSEEDQEKALVGRNRPIG